MVVNCSRCNSSGFIVKSTWEPAPSEPVLTVMWLLGRLEYCPTCDGELKPLPYNHISSNCDCCEE